MNETLKKLNELQSSSEEWEDLPQLYCHVCEESKPFWRDGDKLICVGCDEEYKECEKNG